MQIPDEPWLLGLDPPVAGARERASQAFKLAHLRRVYGSVADRLWRDPPSAYQYMTDPDANTRAVALEIYSMHAEVPPARELEAIFERLAVSDPSESVRSAAIRALARPYWGTDDVRIGRFIAGIVRDENQPRELRADAYLELFFVRGIKPPFKEWLEGHPDTVVVIPDDVDWQFVDSFLIPDRRASPEISPFERGLADAPEPLRSMLRLYFQALDAYRAKRYQRCLELTTASLACVEHPLGYLLRGGAHVRLGQLEEALSDFTRAIRLKPRMERAYRARAVAYRLLGMLHEAEKDDQVARSLAAGSQDTL